MKNKYTKPTDITSYGELWDEDGDLILDGNLVNLFLYLERTKRLQDKKYKYKFLVSKIKFYKNDQPYRVSRERIGTIRKLFNIWKLTFDKPYSLEDLKKSVQDSEFRMELLYREGQKRAAWGMYSAHVRRQNENQEYMDAEKLPTAEKEKELKRLKNRPNLLVIG